MEIYVIIFFILTCFSFLKKDEAVKLIYVLLAIFFILISGLKGKDIGFDYDNYAINMYRDGEMHLLEPGFSLIISIFRPFKNVTIFFLFVAFMAITVKTYIIYRCSYYPILSLLLYFCIAYIMNDLGQIRYGLSMSFMLAALINLAHSERKMFWILSCLAVSVHYSALCAIPVVYVVNRHFSIRQVLFLCFVFSIFTVINIGSFLLLLMNYIPISHINDKIVEYVISEAVDPLGFNISLVLRLFFMFLFYYTIKGNHPNSFFYNALFNMYLYGILWYMLFNSVSEFATRGSGFFKILDLLVIPYIIYFCKPQLIRMGILFLTFFYSAYSLHKILFDPLLSISYVPYRSVLF